MVGEKRDQKCASVIAEKSRGPDLESPSPSNENDNPNGFDAAGHCRSPPNDETIDTSIEVAMQAKVGG